tara:strand:- start:80 stop:562 length:483 start_codon:yes stop_codon:yes gene_type:complete
MYYLPKIEACNGCLATAEQLISALNTNQLEHLDGEIYAHEFWFNKGVSFMKDVTKEQIAFLKLVGEKIKSILTSGNAKHEYNQNGLIIRRGTCIGELGDFMRQLGDGWDCLDFCHGYWVNHSKLQVASYCEGDVVIREAADTAMLSLELDSINTWYKENY